MVLGASAPEKDTVIARRILDKAERLHSKMREAI
jgi:hypothetical protein